MNRLSKFALVVLCLAYAQPALAQGSTLYEQGRDLRAAERFEEALLVLLAAVETNPADTDSLVQLGFTYLALDDLEGAEAVFSRVIELAPDYVDASYGLAQVRLREGNFDAAEALAQGVAMQQPTYADAVTLLADVDNARAAYSAYRIDLGFEVSEATNGTSWFSRTLGVSYRISDDLTISASVDMQDRGNLSDSQYTLRGDQQFGNGLAGYLSASTTPYADFRPVWGVRAGVQQASSATGSVAVTTGADFGLDWNTGTIDGRFHPWASFVTMDGLLTLTPRLYYNWRNSGQQSLGYGVAAQLALSDQLTLDLTFADVPEIVVGGVDDVQTFGLSGTYATDSGVTLRASYSLENRHSYQRNTVSVGIGAWF